MGGYGSGKRRGDWKRPTKEESFVVSSTYFHQEDLLEKEQSYKKVASLTFTFNNSRSDSSIGVYTRSNRVWLEYTVKKDLDSDKEVSYSFPVEWTECYFGGYRPWFICPGLGCGKRVEKLYKPPSEIYFACRHCHDISYYRCNISGKPVKVAQYKRDKVAEKLGKTTCSSIDPLKPTKPKNMHWDTYEDLLQEWEYWDKQCDKMFLKKLRELSGVWDERREKN